MGKKCTIKVCIVRMDRAERAHLQEDRKVTKRICQQTNDTHGTAAS
jgi:hypothetical protein